MSTGLRILLPWFSRSGTTERVARRAAEELRRTGHRIECFPIRPLFELTYPLWLALSFYPGSRFPIHGPLPTPSEFGACLLALPKWTLSCPPVNEFLARCAGKLPPTAVLLTCGGWDQERYLHDLEQELRTMGTHVLGGLALKRKRIEEGSQGSELVHFLARTFAPSEG